MVHYVAPDFSIDYIYKTAPLSSEFSDPDFEIDFGDLIGKGGGGG